MRPKVALSISKAEGATTGAPEIKAHLVRAGCKNLTTQVLHLKGIKGLLGDYSKNV
jgi:hypothetical protein